MSGSVYFSLWVLFSLLTYFRFKTVVKRERSNPDLMFSNPQMLIALNVLLNTQLGHILVIIGSLIPIFWVMMFVDWLQHVKK